MPKGRSPLPKSRSPLPKARASSSRMPPLLRSSTPILM